MRFIVMIAVAAILTPAALTARAAAVPQASAAETAPTDLSAAQKKKKPARPAKKTEEYLKAAPGTGPSGPKN